MIKPEFKIIVANYLTGTLINLEDVTNLDFESFRKHFDSEICTFNIGNNLKYLTVLIKEDLVEKFKLIEMDGRELTLQISLNNKRKKYVELFGTDYCIYTYEILANNIDNLKIRVVILDKED